MPKAKPYILVIVNDNGQYDLVGTPTYRNQVLADYLKRVGVSNKVQPGTYVFTMRRKGLKIHTHLTPIAS